MLLQLQSARSHPAVGHAHDHAAGHQADRYVGHQADRFVGQHEAESTEDRVYRLSRSRRQAG